MSWWLWLLLTALMIVVVLLLLFLIQWLLRRRATEETVAEVRPGPEAVVEPAPAAAEEPAPVVEVELEAPEPDDLKVIEGIGPKIASLLEEAGIATFAQLAATEVSRLGLILEQAQIRLADPSTWPEQAQLAAAGDWEALDAFQEQLKGGRRI